MNSSIIFPFNRTDNFPVFEHSQRRYLIWKRLGRRFALRGLLFHTLLSVETHHIELIPTSGPTLLMMNHQGGIDPVVLMGAVGPRYLCVMSKIENFRIPVIARLIRLWGSYPIRRGIVDRRALDYTLRLLAEDELVLMAPEGHRSASLQKAKDGLAYLAVKSGAAIVPVALCGTAAVDHNWRRVRRTHVSVTFGRPFRFKTSGADHVPRSDLAKMSREAMYQLALLLDSPQRGYYADLSQLTTDTLEFL